MGWKNENKKEKNNTCNDVINNINYYFNFTI